MNELSSLNMQHLVRPPVLSTSAAHARSCCRGTSGTTCNCCEARGEVKWRRRRSSNRRRYRPPSTAPASLRTWTFHDEDHEDRFPTDLDARNIDYSLSAVRSTKFNTVNYNKWI
ncbi:hypothetical protein J6590_001911 [Homalodisca vitripennis]|nr:hypothetical protein J6590_001911 [Homalodisca vitripennis]